MNLVLCDALRPMDYCYPARILAIGGTSRVPLEVYDRSNEGYCRRALAHEVRYWPVSDHFSCEKNP